MRIRTCFIIIAVVDDGDNDNDLRRRNHDCLQNYYTIMTSFNTIKIT